jgi:hypothetical protein
VTNLLAVEQRATWTDERLDDLMESIRSGFARGDQDIRELRAETRHDSAALRTEMREEFFSVRTEMREEFTSVRTEMRDGFAALRGEIDSLRLTLLRVGGAMMIALLGVIAAILARGV